MTTDNEPTCEQCIHDIALAATTILMQTGKPLPDERIDEARMTYCIV